METIQGNPWVIGALIALILVLFCVERLIICERRRHIRHAHPNYFGEERNEPIDD